MPYRVNAPEAIHQTIEGEVILINLSTGNYYSLRDTAAEVWAMLEAGMEPDEAAGRLAARYGASEEETGSHVRDLVEHLREEGLLAEADPAADASPPPAGEDPPAAEYTPPAVEKFEDMQDLILLDPVHEVDAREGWPHVPGA